MNTENQGRDLVIFKSGPLTKHLGISNQTIRRWVNRYPDLFSEDSQVENKYEMRYTPDDILIMTTILQLSEEGLRLDAIEEQLRAGIRYGDEIVNSLIASLGEKPSTAQKSVPPRFIQFELKQTRSERDQAIQDKRLLEEKNESLLREIAELKYHLGMVEGELNSLRRQLEKQP